MKKIIYGLALCTVLIVAAPAAAQILIEEGKISLPAKPGETIMNSFFVHNTSEQKITVKSYWEDFVYVPPFDGQKKFFPPGSTDRSLSKWANFTPQEFILPPFGKKKIMYSIKVPLAAKGGYYSVLFFEKGEAVLQDKTGVRVVTRVGCLFFLETDDKNKNVRMEQATVDGRILKADFVNSGDVIMIPQGTFDVLGADGLVADRGELTKFFLPPGERTKFDVGLSSALPAGKYTLVVTFDLGEGDTLVKEIDFTKDADASLKLLQVRD